MIKTLWVDDDLSIVESHQITAEDYDINLCHFDNWQEGQEELQNNFNDYSAIILDAHCVLNRGEATDESFLYVVGTKLSGIFEKKNSQIPWFIYSAGHEKITNFNQVARSVSKTREESWGQGIYQKTIRGDFEKLLAKIVELAPQNENFKIKYQYQKLFEVLDCPDFIDPEVKTIMLDNLKHIYYGTEELDYENEFNKPRKVLECIFKAIHKKGLLPDECVKNGENGVNLNYSCRYINGLNFISTTKRNKEIRFGVEGEYILPPILGNCLFNQVLALCNAYSHTEKDKTPKFPKSIIKSLWESCILTLCAVIEYLGDYCKEHDDDEINRLKISEIELTSKSKK